jgi:hypothetical protein
LFLNRFALLFRTQSVSLRRAFLLSVSKTDGSEQYKRERVQPVLLDQMFFSPIDAKPA